MGNGMSRLTNIINLESESACTERKVSFLFKDNIFSLHFLANCAINLTKCCCQLKDTFCIASSSKVKF